MEHFCTLFDLGFLPQGLALHRSMREHLGPFTLWILCLDDETYTSLQTLQLPEVRTMRLAECETDDLRAARANRSYGEYCWTLASHCFSFVWDRDPTVPRLTYLDADVFFLGAPRDFFAELEGAGKSVLVTEHAFAPEHAHHEKSAGRFCVQFVTFCFEPRALRLLAQWQAQTRESCSSAKDAAKFGDQQYLDDWPVSHADIVHVLEPRNRTLAPWNADHAASQRDGWAPVLFHFHSFRLAGHRWTIWCHGYRIRTARMRAAYASYQSAIDSALAQMRDARLPARRQKVNLRGLNLLRFARSYALRRLVLHFHPPRFPAHGS